MYCNVVFIMIYQTGFAVTPALFLFQASQVKKIAVCFAWGTAVVEKSPGCREQALGLGKVNVHSVWGHTDLSLCELRGI